MKILDRYLIREIIPPMVIGLALLTFALMLPPILQQGARLIEKGVDWKIIVRVLWTLVPQALSITIPMALLLGILVGLGRVSSDREFVAMQACGISVYRVVRPVGLLAIVACAATAYETLIATPDANQTFRQITFNVVASKAEDDIKPRIFFQEFPNRVLYVRDTPPGQGWKDIFVADSTKADQTTVYFADTGRLVVDRQKQTVQLLLERGMVHTVSPNKPETYDASAFERLMLNMDAETVFPRTQVIKGDNEMSIAELRARIVENEKAHAQSYSQYFTIQQKFSIPVACLVLSLIGVALGVSNRREGKLGTIALGLGVVFVYYVALYSSRAFALAGTVSPSLAPWIANILLGPVGIAMVLWRARTADQPIRINIPKLWSRKPSTAAVQTGSSAPARDKVVVVVRLPHFGLPRPRLLDLYISRLYLATFGLSFFALVGIFYISTFIDLADRLFRGAATTGTLLRFFYYQTPQYVYYIIPLSALVATLVTIGLLTKNSELTVMRACGISIYRSALPLVVFAAVLSGVLYELQERVLAESNREAGRLNAIMRNWPVQTFGTLSRRWIVGTGGDIYYYDLFDPQTNQFERLSLFRLDQANWKLGSLTFAKTVTLDHRSTSEEQPDKWVAHDGWMRQFIEAPRMNAVRTVAAYEPFTERIVPLEPPSYFRETMDPDADRMTYGQLKAYVEHLRARGYHAVPYMVQLQQKVAFPFVTLIMTMLAVPFAATTGRRGALSGIGVGIVLAIIYRIAMVVFAALGAGGWLSPVLGAWAPNILFAVAATYMILTVRT